MPSMISYSIGYTAIDAAGTTVTVAPPPAYQAGDLLVMGVIAGGTSAAVVSAGTPSGWTARSSPGAGLGVFTKTATGSESSYTVTLSGTSCAAVFTAAYPAGTVSAAGFHSSGADVVAYTPAFPSGVTPGETVLLVAGAVASPADPNGNNGYQNVNLPAGSGWTTEVPVFGPALPDNTSSVSPVAIGLADVTGSTAAQALTSPQGCTLYGGYLVLTLTGANASLGVTATVAYPQAVPGLALTVKALAGAASPAAIAAGGAAVSAGDGTSSTPQAAITPRGTGSIVYGAATENISITSGTSFTPNSSTTFTQNVTSAPLSSFILGTLRSAGTTTASSALTLGGTAPSGVYYTLALAEILAASGATLSETATATAHGVVPGDYATTSVAQTAIFRNAPPPGTLLVAMVSANSDWSLGSFANVTVADTAGLTWTLLAEAQFPSYSGVFVAEVSASITPNTGTSADSGSSTSATQAITVPAGVRGGDVVFVHADAVVLTSTAPVITAASTGTSLTQAHAPVTGSETTPTAAAVAGGLWYFVAAGTAGSASTDAGKVITVTASAASYWSAALYAYSGCNTSSPVDVVSGAYGGGNSNTVTCPVLTTGKNGDWAVYLGGGASAGGSFAGPSGSTSRVSDSSAANTSAGIFDSGGSAGTAGTSIGGGHFTSATASTAMLTAFTVGLTAPSSVSGPPAPFTLPARAVKQHPAARRGASRGSRGAPYVYVPPPPAPPYDAVLDEGGSPVLDEGGGLVLDETRAPVPPQGPGKAKYGRRAARTGTGKGSKGAKYVYVPPGPVAPFSLPHRAAERHPSARKGTAKGSPGAPYVYVPVIPAPFTLPSRAAAPHPSARRGSSQGSAGAPYSGNVPLPAYTVLDESGSPVLDEGGGFVLDEGGPYPVSGTLTWTAARAGMPGDNGAVNYPDQAAQFLVTHGVTPVYAGAREWIAAVVSGAAQNNFSWLGEGAPGWLPAFDVSQPFVLTSATVGRVQVPVQVSGSGADLQVTLCPDNGSGSPNLASPLASVTVPASHVSAQAAAGSLASAGPLATAQYNMSALGSYTSGAWAQPAVSSNGAGSFATPATSGNFTVLAGGYDATANAASGTVSVIAYQGTSVSGGATQPPLPQAAWYAGVTITADSVVVAGGRSVGTIYPAVWTAPWTPGTGTVGAWSAQTALPVANVQGAMVSWGTQVYVLGGTATGLASGATGNVWTASAQSGQVTAWTACPALPEAVILPYAAVIGDWLIVAGGQNASGTVQSATWYTAINADGTLAGWRPGPALPQPCYAYGPGWNLAVTDSAMAVVSGTVSGGGASQYTQVLAVSPDGPAGTWQVQTWYGSVAGAYQCAAYPAGPSGQWQVFNLHTTSYDTALLSPVALVSVPLPASGLTPGATYHLVMHQSGGSLNDSLLLGVLTSSSGNHWLTAPAGTGGPWISEVNQLIPVTVWDKTAGGSVLHLVEDGGARVTSPVWSGSSGQLLGLMESTAFPAGSPEAVLGTVTEVSWTGNYPAGLTQLA